MRMTFITLVTVLAGCANTGTPVLDDHFGYAVNMAKSQQTINPDASLNTDPVAGIDGVAADNAIDRYHKITKEPQPTFNIGGGIGGGGSR